MSTPLPLMFIADVRDSDSAYHANVSLRYCSSTDFACIESWEANELSDTQGAAFDGDILKGVDWLLVETVPLTVLTLSSSAHEDIETDAAALRDHVESFLVALDEKERMTGSDVAAVRFVRWLLLKDPPVALGLAGRLGVRLTLSSVVTLIVCDNVLLRSIVLLVVLDMVPVRVPWGRQNNGAFTLLPAQVFTKFARAPLAFMFVLQTFISHTFLKYVTFDGTVPFRQFDCRYNLYNVVEAPQLSGMVPLRLLYDSVICCSCGMAPQLDGSVPLRLL
jgi:hypothetical protein